MAYKNPFDIARETLANIGNKAKNIATGFNAAATNANTYLTNTIGPKPIINAAKNFYAGSSTPPTVANLPEVAKRSLQSQAYAIGSGLSFANPVPFAVQAVGNIPKVANFVSSALQAGPQYQARSEAVKGVLNQIPGIKNTPIPGAVSFIEPFLTDNPTGAIKNLKGAGAIVSNLGSKGASIKIHPDDIREINQSVEYLKTALTKDVAGDTEGVVRNLTQTLDHYLMKIGFTKKQLSKLTPELKYKELPPEIQSNLRASGLIGKVKTLTSRLVSETGTKNSAIIQEQKGVSNLSKYLPDTGAMSSKGSSTANYISELTKTRKSISDKNKPGIIGGATNFLDDVKNKFVDSTAPIEDALSSAEKKYKFNVTPKYDVRLQIDRVLRSKTLASQFAEDNGLVDAIKKAPDLNALDQYMIAKQAGRVKELGKITGRDLVKDKQLLSDLAPVYEPIAQQVNQYSRKLLDYSVKTGLIDQKLATSLIQKYPDYVPLQRVFSELEQKQLGNIGTKSVASLSKQSVVQKLVGSEREIKSPIESLLLKTQDAFNQGERNIAAKQLSEFRNLPGLNKVMTKGNTGPNTISFLENGIKKTFTTTPEIAAAAKSLNQEQIGLLGKIFSTSTRLLQLGATGLNLPFVATNVLKDEITGFINSKYAAKTSLLNPVNFVKSLFSAVGHDDLYKEVVRNAAGGTSFDIARTAPELTVAKLRSGKNLASKIKYTVTNPGELLRAVEDVIGRSEESGRIKNYAGAKQALVFQGRTLEDATLLAAKNARESTANFARKGEWGKVLNFVIPFFNAGIQGARQLVRSFQNDPSGTSLKVGVSVFAPIAATTSWNLSDPARREVYQDIPQYEKDNNLIIIPTNPTKDENGKWNVIKVPIPPGLSNLGAIERQALEQAYGLDPVKFKDVITNLIAAGTSIDTGSPNKLFSSVTPQLIKPGIETLTNTNLFTGQKIVPEYMKSKLPEEQVKLTTSGTARKIGSVLNTSPLLVENYIKTSLGGLGSQLMNASDTALSATGVIPSSQVGGESVGANVERRFTKSPGGNLLDKVYTDSDKYTQTLNHLKELAKTGNNAEAEKYANANVKVFQTGKTASIIRSKVDKINAAKNKLNKLTSVSKQERDQANIEFNQMLTDLGAEYNQLLQQHK